MWHQSFSATSSMIYILFFRRLSVFSACDAIMFDTHESLYYQGVFIKIRNYVLRVTVKFINNYQQQYIIFKCDI